MKRIFSLCVLATVAFATTPDLKKIAAEVNAKKLSWTAGENDYFKGRSLASTQRLMGYKRNPNRVLPLATFPEEILAATPKQFKTDLNCIGPVLDQGDCGSCWAFGAAESISDRTCLAHGKYIALAPLDLVTCDQDDSGCNGGDPGSAYTYAQTNGLATEGCLPYLTSEGGPVPTCPPSQQPCLNFINTPNCNTTCANGAVYNNDKHFLTSVYGVQGVQQIMTEISTNGPVEAAFTVYQDFLAYKSGVYIQTSQDALGGHAIKIIGYGTLAGVDYWECQNSWTTTWGDGGFFKIRRGTDECGIEDDIVAGTPQ
jgi:cathepsin B